jgi:hypothetical protein
MSDHRTSAQRRRASKRTAILRALRESYPERRTAGQLSDELCEVYGSVVRSLKWLRERKLVAFDHRAAGWLATPPPQRVHAPQGLIDYLRPIMDEGRVPASYLSPERSASGGESD